MICHEALLFGLVIVNEIGMASLSATRQEGAPPADTVICPIPVRLSPPPGLGEVQLLTTGGEHVAEADGGVGDDEAPELPQPKLKNVTTTAAVKRVIRSLFVTGTQRSPVGSRCQRRNVR